MNLFNLPRKIAATEYRLVRLPVIVVHRNLDRRMAEDAPLRVGMERMVAAADSLAGTVTGDAELQRSGAALAQAAQARRLAHSLAEKATQRTVEADTALLESRREATRLREQTRGDAAERRAEIEQRRAADKLAAEQTARRDAAAAATLARREARQKQADANRLAELAAAAKAKR